MYSSESFKQLYNPLRMLRHILHQKGNYDRIKMVEYFMSEYQTDTTDSLNHAKDILALLSEVGVDELNALYLDVIDYPDFIPIGYEKGIQSAIEHLQEEILDGGTMCYEEGIPEEYFSNIYVYNQTGDSLVQTTLLDDLLAAFVKARDEFSQCLSKALSGECEVDYTFVNRLVSLVNITELTYSLINMITLSDFEEVSEMEHEIDKGMVEMNENFHQVSLAVGGLEDYYRNDAALTNELLQVTGNECYVAGIMSCYSYDPTKVSGMEGFVDSIKEGLRKTGEVIMNMLKAIKDFFFGRKKEASEQMQSLTDDLKKELEALQKEDPSTYEINQENIGKLRKMLEDAGLKEVAGYFTNINDFTGLLNAYTKAVDALNKETSRLAEAEKELRDAESKVNEATKEPSNLSEDSSADEKKMIKEAQAAKAQTAKDAVNKAKEKVNSAFLPVTAMAKLKSLKNKLFNKKGQSSEGSDNASDDEKKNVSGNESWMS